MTREKVLQLAWRYLHENAPCLFLHLNGEGMRDGRKRLYKRAHSGGGRKMGMCAISFSPLPGRSM